MAALAYKMRRTGGKVEVFHKSYGWVEALKIKTDIVKIKRYDAREGGFIVHNETHENFRLTGGA